MVFWADGPPIPIRWFFSEPDSPIFEGLNCFYSRNWEDAKDKFDPLGEQPGPRPWANGQGPRYFFPGFQCDPAEWYANGQPPKLLQKPTSRTGVVLCCSDICEDAYEFTIGPITFVQPCSLLVWESDVSFQPYPEDDLLRVSLANVMDFIEPVRWLQFEGHDGFTVKPGLGTFSAVIGLGLIPPAKLAPNPGPGKFLRGDGVWADSLANHVAVDGMTTVAPVVICDMPDGSMPLYHFHLSNVDLINDLWIQVSGTDVDGNVWPGGVVFLGANQDTWWSMTTTHVTGGPIQTPFRQLTFAISSAFAGPPAAYKFRGVWLR